MTPETLIASAAPVLDDVVTEALADPGLADALRSDPARAATLVDTARAVARAAFEEDDPAAQEVAHRTLYRFAAQAGWAPADACRDNEHDLTLQAVRLELERGFEAQLARRAVMPDDVPTAPEDFGSWLEQLALERDLPFDGPSMGAYYRDHATLDQLKEVVAQRSIFFLKEPDPWTMVIPTLKGEAKAGLLDLLLDEYGWGRHDQMHSTVYATLMEKLGLHTGYDHYVEQAAWQFLAGMNYQVMIGRHARLCRRMYGYVFLIEADSPPSMKNYLAAYARAGIDDPDVLRFYELHIDADEGHQDVALNEVVMPVVRAEPASMPEIARGVLEGRFVESLFSHHLHACFTAGRSSLRSAA